MIKRKSSSVRGRNKQKIQREQEIDVLMGGTNGTEDEEDHEIDAQVVGTEIVAIDKEANDGVEKDLEIKDEEIEDVIPLSVSQPQGSEFLESIAMNKGYIPPLVPLCRLVINERVRELRNDLSLLKRILEDDGYFVMKGSFILSTNMPDGTTKDVDETIKKSWDKHWNLVNKEFEEELCRDKRWSMLQNKMFFVWEGNHRTASWMECIRERFQNNKKMHIRVQAQFIVPSEREELKLIATLQRLNM